MVSQKVMARRQSFEVSKFFTLRFAVKNCRQRHHFRNDGCGKNPPHGKLL
jgi:hypothetical protein